MAPTNTSHTENESSDFEGFELDDMPLSFMACANQERESDSNQDMDDFLVESGDEDASASESADDIFVFEERFGPVRNLPPDKKAVNFLYFTQRLYRLIVGETNCYAGQEQQLLAEPLGWIELTVKEFRTWLGIVQKPTLHSYWEKDQVTATPSFVNIMSRNIFMNILRFIHFVDNGSEVSRDPAQHDRLFKICGVLRELQRQFRKNHIPAREV